MTYNAKKTSVREKPSQLVGRTLLLTARSSVRSVRTASCDMMKVKIACDFRNCLVSKRTTTETCKDRDIGQERNGVLVQVWLRHQAVLVRA